MEVIIEFPNGQKFTAILHSLGESDEDKGRTWYMTLERVTANLKAALKRLATKDNPIIHVVGTDDPKMSLHFPVIEMKPIGADSVRIGFVKTKPVYTCLT